ncbi:MAG: hypothetical protein HY423_09810 [Candidatus Lambdaproteobacteria bacterium]|nr:hypothetical protein [Candidatus Lambdaproteobacteria bacterium]
MRRIVAILSAASFLTACTQQVARPPLETRRFQIDWANLPTQPLQAEGLQGEGFVLTPAQWPLEASVKRLLAGDFEGVIDRFDLAFRPSRLEHEVLRKLFAAGYLPAYVRLRNTGAAPIEFAPERLALRADAHTTFAAVPAGELPQRFEEIDWARTGLTVVVVALLLVLVVAAARDNRGRVDLSGVDVGVRSGLDAAARPADARRADATRGGASAEAGLLTPAVLAPGQRQEGFVFFRVERMLVDWTGLALELR